MADNPITSYASKTTPITGDILYLVDSADTTQSPQGTSKQLTVGNLTSGYIASATITLTNKTFDTGGTGNTFKIAGTSVTGVTGTGSAVLAANPQFTNQVGIGTPANAAIALTINTGNDAHEGLVIFANSGTQSALLLDIQNSSFVSKFNVDKNGNTVIAGTVNKITFTQPASAATLTIANNKTLTINNSLTLAGTDATTLTFQGTDTYVGRATTDTLSNKRRVRRVTAVTQSATPTINTDNMDVASITGLAQAITSMTTNLSGTPNDGDLLEVRITDNGTARAITWGASFESSGSVSLPTTTVISTLLRVGFEWNTVTTKWSCIAVA